MAVHSRAVVPKKWLRHEGGALLVSLRDIAHGVFEQLKVIGGTDQSRVTEINFALAGRGHFVVVTLNLNTYLLEFGGNLSAKILQRIERWERYIAFLVPNMKSLIAVAI